MRQTGTYVERYRVGHPPRHFPKESPFFETENTSPHTIERDGNNGGFDILHNALEPTPEREQVPNPGDLAFGKNANQFALLNRFAGRAKRLQHLARA